MYLLALVLLQLLVAICSFWHPRFFAFWFLSILYFVLWYWDGKEYTGERRWPWLQRGWLMARLNPLRITWGKRHTGGKRVLFLMSPCQTPMPVFWAGLRINAAVGNTTFLMPPIFFAIPLLRDVLMWCGATTWQSNTEPQDAVLDLCNMGKCVCWCPPEAKQPNVAFYDFCKHNGIDIVPLIVTNEMARYSIWHPQPNSATWQMQQWFAHRVGYPVPFVFYAHALASPQLHILVGPTIQTHLYQSGEEIKEKYQQLGNEMIAIEI